MTKICPKKTPTISSSNLTEASSTTTRLTTHPPQSCTKTIKPATGYIIQVKEVNGASHYQAFENKYNLLEY